MTSLPGSDPPLAVTAADVYDAAGRLAGHAVRTPLLESAAINEMVGGRVLVKAESLQKTGSFKYRGAFNRLSRLTPEERRRGVVAYSSGNHGQAVAAVARELEISATIVMPADAPEVKCAGVRRHGATIVAYDRTTEEREVVADALVDDTGATLVRPFDDPHIIAGQGTVGREIVDQADALGITPDALLVPCSGGGLIAGCAIAARDRWSGLEVYAVEPVGFDDTARSLASGRRETVVQGAETVCDALRVQTPGEITFEINRRLLSGGLAVEDGETRAAMAAAFLHLKLVVEPGGAPALAAVLSGPYDGRGKTTVVVCSGGNVDAGTYSEALKNV